MQGNYSQIVLVILIIIGLIVLFIFLRKKFKRLILPNVFLIDGAPKTGKTALSLSLARRVYRKNVFNWWLGKGIYWLRYHTINDYPPKPMFYSNIPVKFMHNRLTKEIIFLEVKMPPKSVVFIDEASLFADSQLIKNKEINYRLTLFCKLFGHISRGGTLAINTQTVADLHYALKRVLGSYLFIYHSDKLPFITIAQCRDMVYSDDGNIVNNVNEDAELSQRRIFFFNRVYKQYDCYCYSIYVDDKEYQVDYDFKYDKKDLKARTIVSFNELLKTMYEDGLKGNKKHENSKA